MEELNNENYHGVEARKKYLGSSQFKEFLKCEKEALARVNGEIEDKKTDALLFGSYVDAYFSNEMEQFIPSHPELFNAKTGELKAPFKNVETVIEAIKNDKMMSKYLDGEHQVIMTGIIGGEPFKIKIDSYFIGKAIVDGKCMKDLEKVWVERDGRNVLLDYIAAYDYAMEGALYQEIEHQNALKIDSSAKKLPFILNVATKEEVPNADLVLIDQDILDERLEYFKQKAPRYQRIKLGLEEPKGCGKCPVCVAKKQIFAPKSYKQLYLEEEED